MPERYHARRQSPVYRKTVTLFGVGVSVTAV
ncbi:MAG: hypothetical protein J07HX64_02694 [halophilic archaeon J07HX64]|nr:MAG: hypothetical protein J07HX64_02694 [halophilic archaeon J07HX64]